MLVQRRTYRAKYRRTRKHTQKQKGGYRAKTVRNFVRQCEKAGTEENICYNAINDPTYKNVERRLRRKRASLFL
jgi:hypothetical protein